MTASSSSSAKLMLGLAIGVAILNLALGAASVDAMARYKKAQEEAKKGGTSTKLPDEEKAEKGSLKYASNWNIASFVFVLLSLGFLLFLAVHSKGLAEKADQMVVYQTGLEGIRKMIAETKIISQEQCITFVESISEKTDKLLTAAVAK